MKRTNLVLDEDLLHDAVQILGVKTYSEAVNIALSELIRDRHMQGMAEFIGSGIWEGDLASMRDDRPDTDEAADYYHKASPKSSHKRRRKTSTKKKAHLGRSPQGRATDESARR